MKLLEGIQDCSVDLILCDLPYGTTKNKWDSELDLKKLWEHYKRIMKEDGCVALFAQTPFDKVLGCSNLEMLKYEWVWEKALATGRLNCNFAPMKAHENILIFAKKAASNVKDKSRAMKYFPQMTRGKPYTAKSGRGSENYDVKWQKSVVTKNRGERYPRDVQRFSHDKEKYHPTQKPVALLEYLIKTYTEEGNVVLDNCMGAGSTGVACVNTARRFIGMELDQEYFDIAADRIAKAWREKQL